MRKAPKLTLKRERLAELTAAELGGVAGAAGTLGATCLASCLVASCLDANCISDRLAACDSYLRPCITHTCTR